MYAQGTFDHFIDIIVIFSELSKTLLSDEESLNLGDEESLNLGIKQKTQRRVKEL